MRRRTLCFALLQVLMISVISVAACRADEKIISAVKCWSSESQRLQPVISAPSGEKEREVPGVPEAEQDAKKAIEPATIRISLTGPNGPVEGVRFGLFDRCRYGIPPPDMLLKGTTDANGIATISWPRCEKNTIEIFSMPRSGVNPVTNLPFESGDESRRLAELGLGGFDQRLDIPNDQREIQVDITAPGTVTAELRFVSDERIVDSSIELQPQHLHDVFRVATTGKAKIRWLRKGEPNVGYLVVGTKSGEIAIAIPINFPAAEADVNWGDIQVPSIKLNSWVDILANISRENDPQEMWMQVCEAAVTLVSIDGTSILVGGASRNSDGNGSSHLHVPAGTYFVVPGTFHVSGAHKRLLDRIRANEDLTNSGIPRFTVAEGETAKLEYSWVDAWRAIFQKP